jgi:hypothetical protein
VQFDKVTGRDKLIIAQALVYAIHFIDTLPREYQPLSNRDDMLAILKTIYPDEWSRETWSTALERATGRKPDLRPSDEVRPQLRLVTDDKEKR